MYVTYVAVSTHRAKRDYRGESDKVYITHSIYRSGIKLGLMTGNDHNRKTINNYYPGP